MIKILKEWVKPLLIAVVVALVINNFIIVNAVVPTASMASTIEVGDRLFANRMAYLFSSPERGDIIVFDGTDKDKLFVKRIIGLPGDIILIKDGLVYINDNPLIDDYTDVVINGSFGPYEVPKDHYFMLGDNRNNSDDSRFWTNQYVHESNIRGKIFVKYYPKLKLY